MHEEFEPELQRPAPRPVPSWYGQSRYAQQLQRRSWLAALTGVFCIVFAQTPWIQRLGLYFLPLAYLDYIGVVLLLVAAVKLGKRLSGGGNLRYLRHGIPVRARVTALAIVPTVRSNGVDARYAFAADITYPLPDDGRIVSYRTLSDDFLADNVNRYTTTIKVGDSVTAIYLPGKPDSLKLYGFLGLNPRLEFIVDRRGFDKDTHRLMMYGQALSIGLLFAALITCVYSLAFYRPVNFQWNEMVLPFLAAGTVMSILGFLLAYRVSASLKAQWRKRALEAQAAGEPEVAPFNSLLDRRDPASLLFKGLLFAGSAVLSTLFLLCGAFLMNAVLDDSPPKHMPVQVVGLVQKLHHLIVREYKIEFLDPTTQAKESIATDPVRQQELLSPYGGFKPAQAEFHQGTFGWRWVKEIKPIPTQTGS